MYSGAGFISDSSPGGVCVCGGCGACGYGLTLLLIGGLPGIGSADRRGSVPAAMGTARMGPVIRDGIRRRTATPVPPAGPRGAPLAGVSPMSIPGERDYPLDETGLPAYAQRLADFHRGCRREIEAVLDALAIPAGATI